MLLLLLLSLLLLCSRCPYLRRPKAVGGLRPCGLLNIVYRTDGSRLSTGRISRILQGPAGRRDSDAFSCRITMSIEAILSKFDTYIDMQ